MDVVHGVELRRGGVAPREAERAHPALHFAKHPARFLEQARSGDIAAADDVIPVVAHALRRLAAAGDHEARAMSSSAGTVYENACRLGSDGGLTAGRRSSARPDSARPR